MAMKTTVKDLRIMVNAINRINQKKGRNDILLDGNLRLWQDDEILLSKKTKKETYLYLSGLYDGLRQG